ncbi:uncharacterized protein LOC119835226 [Zerene cesonia]|uniref:uncharacterized protein LOC119835226 n=1 Tax=Zerene cesonia TaxID=33412 RepID=UPI0018E4E799|nr:uncharacterized protein LOC119835226 [Zerene cesonia]
MFKMEPDSTTYDISNSSKDVSFPFCVGQCNLSLYKHFVSGEKNTEIQLIERLQTFGLLPKTILCLENKPTCKVMCKSARVVDRVQWICEGCKRKQPIRIGSFFYRLQCTMVQALQMILAWCEDADVHVAAEFFDVKPRVAVAIYDKLDELTASELSNTKLGGEDAVVLSEMYPDCLNRLSPDTTDQPHVHQILMMADTKHIPTHYRFHVMKNHLKKVSNSCNEESLQEEVENTLSSVTHGNSLVVSGNNIPIVDGTASIAQLVQHCDVEMQHFLSNRIWSQAITLCNASRDLCSGGPSLLCASTVQRYLDTSLYRLRYGDGFYEHMLKIIANKFTDKYEICKEE